MVQGGLRYQFARLGMAEKLIAVNVVVFILNGLCVFLLKLHPDFFVRWFELPKDFKAFFAQPWSLVTYSFFHGGFGHIFWNMLLLYFAGRIVLNLFDTKKFLSIYFLGVIVGGLFFLLGYSVFPVFLDMPTSGIIGASAGVTAVLIFACTYLPNQEVRLFFFNVKLWHIGLVVVLKDLILIPYGTNSGGSIAHLGGALLGYVYARQLLDGRDIGASFVRFFESFVNAFKKKEKKAPMKTVYKKRAANTKTTNLDQKSANQRKIDSILDKIGKSGYESLSKEEKDFLFKAGKEDQ